MLTFVKGLPRLVVFIIRLVVCCLVRVAASLELLELSRTSMAAKETLKQSS